MGADPATYMIFFVHSYSEDNLAFLCVLLVNSISSLTGCRRHQTTPAPLGITCRAPRSDPKEARSCATFSEVRDVAGPRTLDKEGEQAHQKRCWPERRTGSSRTYKDPGKEDEWQEGPTKLMAARKERLKHRLGRQSVLHAAEASTHTFGYRSLHDYGHPPLTERACTPGPGQSMTAGQQLACTKLDPLQASEQANSKWRDDWLHAAVAAGGSR